VAAPPLRHAELRNLDNSVIEVVTAYAKVRFRPLDHPSVIMQDCGHVLHDDVRRPYDFGKAGNSVVQTVPRVVPPAVIV
jgi:hypothetical protein